MAQGASPKCTDSGTQGISKMEKKKGTEKKIGDIADQSRDDLTAESEPETSRVEEPNTEVHIPTKDEMTEMFLRLENSIKTDINSLRIDLGHLLARVEKTEKSTEKQMQELCDLKEQVKITQQNQRKILYRLEDQENRNRRQNLRIRMVQEERGEDLRKNICPLLGKGAAEFPRIERAHRVRRSGNIEEGRPRT